MLQVPLVWKAPNKGRDMRIDFNKLVKWGFKHEVIAPLVVYSLFSALFTGAAHQRAEEDSISTNVRSISSIAGIDSIAKTKQTPYEELEKKQTELLDHIKRVNYKIVRGAETWCWAVLPLGYSYNLTDRPRDGSPNFSRFLRSHDQVC